MLWEREDDHFVVAGPYNIYIYIYIYIYKGIYIYVYKLSQRDIICMY